MTRDEIAFVMKDLIHLNDSGIGLYRYGQGLTVDERAVKLQQDREQLLRREVECTKVYEWLCQMNKIRSINIYHNSYELKHLAERTIGYVTNGAFIVAAIHRGFECRRDRYTQNIFINISNKSVTAEAKRVGIVL